MAKIGPSSTLLLIASISDFDEDFFEKYGIVPADRLERIKSFKNERARRERILAWSLFSLGYERICEKSADECRIESANNSKPILAQGGLCFNISHSGSAVCCAFSKRPVGADVQQISSPSDDMAKRVLTEAELELLNTGGRADAFTRLWTLKESYLKRTSYGIGYGLSRLDFSACAAKSRFRKYNSTFFVFQPYDGYYLSVCTKDDSLETEFVGKDKLKY